MAATESSAGNCLKGETGTVAAIQRAAGIEVVGTAYRECTVHWGPASSKRYLAAATEVAAGTTVEATADRVRAHVVDAIGEERLEPEPATGATNEIGDEGLGEGAAAEAAKEKEREKQRREKQRRRQKKETAAAAEAVSVRAEIEAAKAEAEATAKATEVVRSAVAAVSAEATPAEDAAVDAAGAA